MQQALELGLRRVDVGQGPEIEHDDLTDPDSNELPIRFQWKIRLRRNGPGRRAQGRPG